MIGHWGLDIYSFYLVVNISSEQKVIIAGLLLTALIIAVGAWWATSRDLPTAKPVVESQRLVRADDAHWGASNAHVTLVAFSNFACAECRELQGVLNQLRDAYAGKPVQFVFRHYPENETAEIVAEALAAAQEEGRFWELYDRLSQEESDLTQKRVEQIGKSAGMNLGLLREALEQHIYREVVEQDRVDGQAVGVRTAPAIFLNGVYVAEKPTLEVLRMKIEEALVKAKNRK